MKQQYNYLSRRVQRMNVRVTIPVIFFAVALAAPLAKADRRVVGLSASGKPIEALTVAGAAPTAPTVLLIGGLNGEPSPGE